MKHNTKYAVFHRRTLDALLCALALTLSAGVQARDDENEHQLFIESAIELPGDVVSMRKYEGEDLRGNPVTFVIFDTSDGKDAARLGVNQASKLTNARGTAAVMKVTVRADGKIIFPASVDFSGKRVVEPTPSTGFPPLSAVPGPLAEPGYSPLIQMPNGTIRNAPHVANPTGQHPKVVGIDAGANRVRLQETIGFANGKKVYYVSTESSTEAGAALENATYAPALGAAPFPGGDGTDSSRAKLVGFVNGQTGADNPDRQGFNSALLDGLPPLNVLAWTPNQGRYSPLWDVFFGEYSGAALAGGLNTLQTDVGDIEGLVQKGYVTGVGGSAFLPIDAIVNCPVVSRD